MERFIDGIDGIDINDPGLGDAKLPEEMIENEDGSVTLLDPEEQAPKQTQFLDNLAESLDQHDLNSISLDLLEKIEIDKQSRSKRDEQYEEGIQRTGLGDDAPGGAEFSGASKVVHPVLAEVCVDFASSAIRELFPPSGPVRTKIRGKENQQKREIAERKSEYLNWQLTQQISEYRENLEQRLSQVPLGGSQYQKFFYDTRLGRPAEEFVPVDEVYLPYHATNFYTASRFTHAYRISRQTFEERVESGLYRLGRTLGCPPCPRPCRWLVRRRNFPSRQDQRLRRHRGHHVPPGKCRAAVCRHIGNVLGGRRGQRPGHRSRNLHGRLDRRRIKNY
jgi:hypothetical protein